MQNTVQQMVTPFRDEWFASQLRSILAATVMLPYLPQARPLASNHASTTPFSYHML